MVELLWVAISGVSLGLGCLVHGGCVTFVSGLLVPIARLGVVLRHAMTLVVKQAEVKHGIGVVLAIASASAATSIGRRILWRLRNTVEK